MVANECKKCIHFELKEDKSGQYGYCNFCEDEINLDYHGNCHCTFCEEDELCINCLYVCEDRIGLWCGLDGKIVRYNTYCIKWEERDPKRIERYLYDGTIQPRKVQ